MDGQRRVLSHGQTSPEAIRLLSADSDASVLEGPGTVAEVLLGMTYLGHVEMEREGEAMVLRQKH
ncbi:MAG: hypothetical protein AB7U81_15300 [Thiohalomonadaceae bacterium]